ncbi:MAG TPA: aspartate aminotransferase family protein [Candidatus Sulfotelmatobacter sp.]|nr:aspartate aminotransferase family protein [Candidatus Sulfotelmatobacter sp.]HEV3511283.1 aspartate aminotransferase family protein [Candidatus Sulfotelmatobacter sp.]
MLTSIPSKPRSSVLRRSFRKQFPSAVRGEGVYIWDSDGNKYLDLSGSAAVNLIGHGVPEIATAIAEQAEHLEFVHTSQFTTPAGEQYAEELLAFAGEHFRGGAVYFTCGGSESIETALKLARQYQVETGHIRRHQILSRTQSYHGATLGALSVSGNTRRREIYLPMIREFTHIGMPYPYRCAFNCTDGCRTCGPRYAAELEHAIETANGEAAGFIFEPVSGATLGAVVPPAGYLESIADICRRHDILLIADEVMTGMGRTGRNFAVEHWKVMPDILVAAKGLSSGYAPLGAVIASKKIVDAIAGGSGAFLHGFTYNAHPISLAAGRAVLRFLQTHNLVTAADSDLSGTPASDFKQALEGLRKEESVGDVRGVGLLWAVEFVADKSTKRPFAPDETFSSRVASAALKRGLLVYPMQGSLDGVSGDHILLAPPAVITKDQIAWSVEQLSSAIREA